MIAAAFATGPDAVQAQAARTGDAVPQVQLFAGDSVRIDGSLVGTVLSIEGPRMTVVSRGAPRCRAGEMHGDAPLCDPAPIFRQEMDLSTVSVERRMQKGHMTARTFVGGLIGAAAFGAAGYFIGPEVGFGKVGCPLVVGTTPICSNPLEPSELARRQKVSDQRKGVVFFGLVGGTFTAIMARKLSVGWVHVEPALPRSPADPWGLSFSVPSGH